LVICSSSDVKGWAEDKDDEASNFGKAIRTYHATADIAQMHDLASTKEVNELFKRAKQYNVIIIRVLEMSPEHSQRLLVNKLSAYHIALVVVASKNPYALLHFPRLSTYFNTYEPNLSALKMAAVSIYGHIEVNEK